MLCVHFKLVFKAAGIIFKTCKGEIHDSIFEKSASKWFKCFKGRNLISLHKAQRKTIIISSGLCCFKLQYTGCLCLHRNRVTAINFNNSDNWNQWQLTQISYNAEVIYRIWVYLAQVHKCIVGGKDRTHDTHDRILIWWVRHKWVLTVDSSHYNSNVYLLNVDLSSMVQGHICMVGFEDRTHWYLIILVCHKAIRRKRLMWTVLATIHKAIYQVI